MTMWGSPTITDPGVGGSGGGPSPWWSFPTPLGPPKQVSNPRACYHGIYVVHDNTGEWYWGEYPCPPWFPPDKGIPEGMNPP